jgi:hypothetical protein
MTGIEVEKDETGLRDARSNGAEAATPVRSAAPRPAFYALRPGGWRDIVTVLHPPYSTS